MHGFLSKACVLGCGIAQGRRFSVHVFNSLLSWLRTEVERRIPLGVSAWVPHPVVMALKKIDLADPACDFHSPPSSMVFFQPILDYWTFMQQNFTPVRQSEALADILVRLPKFADRCFLLDAIGFTGVGPLQYVDDTAIPCSSSP